jgi:GNAT superfamily N-acetyltransferase
LDQHHRADRPDAPSGGHSPRPTIRLALPSDAPALAALAVRTFRDTYESHNSAEDMALHVAQSFGASHQGRELADPEIITLVAEIGNDLAGYAQLRRKRPPACVEGAAPIELWRFYVDKAWHGQGIAQALMERVEAEAARAGASTLWLGVWERNDRALAYYRKSGFVEVGSHTFVVGSDAQTDRVMVRPVRRTG